MAHFAQPVAVTLTHGKKKKKKVTAWICETVILHSQSSHTEIALAISYWYTLWQIMNVIIHGHGND